MGIKLQDLGYASPTHRAHSNPSPSPFDLTAQLRDALHNMLVTRLIPSLAVFTGLFGLAARATNSTRSNVVDLGYVKYRGNLSYPNTVAYLGVPYAEPPLGERRWRVPLALNTSRVSNEAAGQIVDLTTNPNFCIQGSTGGE